MKKALILLVCLFALGASQMVSADNAGLGFEWNIGPSVPLAANFQMQGFNNRFDLNWQVGDTLRVGVFNEYGSLRAKHEYTSNLGGTPTCTEVYNGSISQNGLDINSTIPGLDMLMFGIELGVANVQDAATTVTYSRSDGAAGSSADFNPVAAVSPGLAGNYPLVGVRGRWTMLSAKSKGLWSEVSLGAALRIVPLSDTYTFGTQDHNLATPTKIDPVTNLNSLDVTLGVTIGF